MWRHYVYLHRRADDGEVFYVGKGSVRTRKKAPDYERAFYRKKRSAWWNSVANKHGLTVEIVASCMTDEAAQELEMSLIAKYGRANLGKGSLVNLTDGGDGHAGIVQTPELRKKRSVAASRPRGEAWVAAIRKARKNGGNGGVVKKGDRLPQQWVDNIAAGKLGERNPMHGRTGDRHPMSRRVVDVETGRVYASVSEAAADLGFIMGSLYNAISGLRVNRTGLRFSDVA